MRHDHRWAIRFVGYSVGVLAVLGLAGCQKPAPPAEPPPPTVGAVRDAELNLGYCRMYAPLEGRIGEAKVKVGNLVGPESTGGGAFSELATIQQLDPMGVDVRLSSRDLDRTRQLIQKRLPSA